MTLYKLVVLGEGGVGKSALTIQFTQNHFVKEYDPTIENSYRKQITYEDEVCILDILDTAGQEEYSVMRDQYIHSGQGFILVYSVTCKTSFMALLELRNKVLQVKDRDDFPMVLVGNKCDLQCREVSTQEAKESATKWDVPFFESSAKSRINVEETFKALVKEIRKLGDKTGESLPKRPKKKGLCNLL